MDSEAILRATTSKSENLGTTPHRGIFFVDQVPCKLLADVAKFCEYCI
jgi:hypothetical protein